MKKLNLLLGLIFITCSTLVAAVGVGYTFRLDEIGRRVSKKIEKTRSWCNFFSRSKSEPTVNGIGLVLAFERLGIDQPVSPSVLVRYTILDLLQLLDQNLCQDLVAYKRKHGYKDWNNFSEEDFRQLDVITKKYVDAVSAVLIGKYGEAARPYVDEINKVRHDFESRNNGYLLERI